jgi:hypothetical protein
MKVLDALLAIQWDTDPTLAFRFPAGWRCAARARADERPGRAGLPGRGSGRRWAGEATLEFLLYLASLGTAQVSLVLTCRPEDVPKESLLRRLSRLAAGSTGLRLASSSRERSAARSRRSPPAGVAVAAAGPFSSTTAVAAAVAAPRKRCQGR